MHDIFYPILDRVRYNEWILPALLIIPALGALLVMALAPLLRPAIRSAGPASEERSVDAAAVGLDTDEWALGGPARAITLAVFVLEFVLSLGLWWSYKVGGAEFQAIVDKPWIPDWGVRFKVGVDGISLMMVILTTATMPLAVLGGWTSIRRKPYAYYALLLILTTGMLGVFVSLDLFLFYVMWELMLVPMYFIIGIWGGERRIYASIKFFIYTMLGSLLMLVAIVYIGFEAGKNGAPNFDYGAARDIAAQLQQTEAKVWGNVLPVSILLFGAFFLAFAVKVPMFPFHTWLPDAHVEAPTAGSVILAGIMLKMGTYGFLRFAVPLLPGAALTPWVRNIVLGLAVVGIIYGALVALVQPDFKKLVAYSSVSHLGFVMLGIFAFTVESVQGAVLVMINHGISTGALFFLIGMIYERRHTRAIADYGGIARVVPLFAALLTLVSLSSIGLPGTNGFIGEFLVLVGSFQTHPYLALIATTGVIFAAAYLLWAIQRVLFNAFDKPANAHISDLNGREIALMVPLVFGILLLGIYPRPVLFRTEGAARTFVRIAEQGAGRPTQAAAAEGRR
ncbi:MAG TPA: NADH-quinone oxidoreductase subunit M [Gemmatimonadaceae bacterium]|nr:NADH-quinone oxidoreductase subunit M [Gemmatimonadaceae bacterium]